MNNDLPNLDTLLDTQLAVTAELGSIKRPFKEMLSLRIGDLLDLGCDAGSPINLYINKKLFGRGEIVAAGETFGIRIIEINPMVA